MNASIAVALQNALLSRLRLVPASDFATVKWYIDQIVEIERERLGVLEQAEGSTPHALDLRTSA
jgi:hypothetical protein